MGHAALPGEMDLPKRKHPRLTGYDYSLNGAYFVTICVRDRECLLGKVVVGRDDLIPPTVELSSAGKTVEGKILSVESAHQTVSMAGYAVMPNHVHILLVLEDGGMGSCRPTVPMIVRGLKRQTRMELGKSIWQGSFFEHIIRNEESYIKHLQYMESNPAKWAEDEYYREQ